MGVRLFVAAQALLRDLINRLSDPVRTEDAQAELTSYAAYKRGQVDFLQLARIAHRVGKISAGEVGQLKDVFESLYVVPHGDEKTDGLGGMGEQGAAGTGQGGTGPQTQTQAQTQRFYSGLAALVERFHGQREERHSTQQGMEQNPELQDGARRAREYRTQKLREKKAQRGGILDGIKESC